MDISKDAVLKVLEGLPVRGTCEDCLISVVTCSVEHLATAVRLAPDSLLQSHIPATFCSLLLSTLEDQEEGGVVFRKRLLRQHGEAISSMLAEWQKPTVIDI